MQGACAIVERRGFHFRSQSVTCPPSSRASCLPATRRAERFLPPPSQCRSVPGQISEATRGIVSPPRPPAPRRRTAPWGPWGPWGEDKARPGTAPSLAHAHAHPRARPHTRTPTHTRLAAPRFRAPRLPSARHIKQQILVMRNRPPGADCRLVTTVWSPQCHTSLSVISGVVLITTVHRAWAVAHRASWARAPGLAAPAAGGSISTRILGRRTAPFPPFLVPDRVPRGFTPRS